MRTEGLPTAGALASLLKPTEFESESAPGVWIECRFGVEKQCLSLSLSLLGKSNRERERETSDLNVRETMHG